jgi:hypothetical protein
VGKLQAQDHQRGQDPVAERQPPLRTGAGGAAAPVGTALLHNASWAVLQGAASSAITAPE